MENLIDLEKDYIRTVHKSYDDFKKLKDICCIDDIELTYIKKDMLYISQNIFTFLLFDRNNIHRIKNIKIYKNAIYFKIDLTDVPNNMEMETFLDAFNARFNEYGIYPISIKSDKIKLKSFYNIKDRDIYIIKCIK